MNQYDFKNVGDAFAGLNTALAAAPTVPTALGPFHEIINATITIRDPQDRLALVSVDNPDLEGYMAAQWSWYALSIQKPLLKPWYPEGWDRMALTETDVHSNYGVYVWAEGQFDFVLNTLKKHPWSRQALMLLNRPSVSMSKTKDHICTTSLQFLIRDDRLHLITTMRSNELHFGFRTDIVFFTMLQEIMASHLDIPLGRYYHNVGSLHVKPDKLTSEPPLPKKWPLFQQGEFYSLWATRAILRDGTIPQKGPFPLTNHMIDLLTKFFHEPTPDSRA